jgi:hypothetical protein
MNKLLIAALTFSALVAALIFKPEDMSLAIARAANAETSLASKRCVVVGGTSGIGG